MTVPALWSRNRGLAYDDFIASKSQHGRDHGFQPDSLPDFLFDFQRDLVAWALRKGRAAIFADCGLGKTPMQLVWADQVARHTDGRVLIATPLAVSHQVEREAAKFGIEVRRSPGDVQPADRIVVTNYERLDRFAAHDFTGMVCDESSILKNFDGVRRAEITELMRTLPYRLLCTATAAPNDYTELGTSAEALGEMGHMDMLTRFFVNAQGNSSHRGMRYRWSRPGTFGSDAKFRFKGHAEQAFWRWVASWARALRRPSDLGYPDDGFVLPDLVEDEHVVDANRPPDGRLFDLPAVNFQEEREERRRTIVERCEKVASLVDHDHQALVWCHLNDEGDLLQKLIPGAVQVKGSDSDDHKEAALRQFADGEVRVLVTKPKIGAWGLNLQGCHHVTFFPTHSYEQYYQGVRRCWRFGQKRPVLVDMVSTNGEQRALESVRRKAEQADRMFDALVAHMNDAIEFAPHEYPHRIEVPPWL